MTELVQRERKQRSLDRRLRNARIGAFKPMDTFDWSWPSKIDRQAVEELFSLSFVWNEETHAHPSLPLREELRARKAFAMSERFLAVVGVRLFVLLVRRGRRRVCRERDDFGVGFGWLSRIRNRILPAMFPGNLGVLCALNVRPRNRRSR
jgi:hypothetical protein